MTDVAVPDGSIKRPTLQFCVLCDAVAPETQGTSKPSLLGLFSSIRGAPVALPQFFIDCRWINGGGTHVQKIRILKPDLAPLTEVALDPFVLDSRTASCDAISGFINLLFPSGGVYWVEIVLDDKLALSFPLPVFPK